MAEQGTFNPKVAGSIPARPIKHVFARVDPLDPLSDPDAVEVLEPGGRANFPLRVSRYLLEAAAVRATLLERAYAVASQGYADLALTTGGITVPLKRWLRDEATLPGGSIVALEGQRVVGYAGLLAWNDDDTRAENGLTAVDRAWRRRGLATALKRRQIAWASASGIRELVTWTQTGNEGMRSVNELVGYTTRTVSLRMRREVGASLEPSGLVAR